MQLKSKAQRTPWACVAAAMGMFTVLHAVPATAQGTRGTVENATFTSAISGGAPTDFRQAFDNTTPVVYYYAEILGLGGQTVTHRWTLEGKIMQAVPIAVKRARQAVWSKSAMRPEWTGDWTVEIVNARGEVIETDNFAFNPPE